MRIKLGTLEQIEDGGARGFDPFQQGRDALFVVRCAETVFAWRNACPHPGYEGASLPWRKHAYLSADKSRIVCSGHGAQFDIATGICLFGPCPGKALQTQRVQIEDQGLLYWYTDELWEK
jgi:nitrite reductase/ring-hydroxylating ferredoxin subunit